ncbi:MAG: trigger factor [Desulfobacteraceae bacterium]|nr:trigger factor [Desulfobacteraceae bacterium]
MKVSVEDQSSVKKVLHIEVPHEDVTTEVESAYQQLKKTAKIKGFRQGKIPRTVLERIYGKDVKSDVSGKLIQNALLEAIQETNLRIVGNPKINPPELNTKSSYSFNAEVEIHPEIKDIDIDGLELTKTKYTVNDEEVGLQLKMIRKNMAQRKKIEQDRPVQTGDIVIIDYEGFINGQPHENTKKTENFNVQVGEAQVVKDLDDGLVGMQVNEQKDIDITFPDDYFNKSLAGQKLVFKVKLNEIQEEILPELNDEFAKSISDQFDCMNTLKSKITENLMQGYDKRTEQELNEQIFQKLMEKSDFELPEVMVASELEHIVTDAEKKFTQNNRKLEDVGLSRQALSEKYRDIAEKQVRRHLILGKLIDQKKLTLTDAELDQGFQEMADTYQQPAEQLRQFYQTNQDGMAFLKHTLLEKKVLKLIIESSKIQEVETEQKAEAK